MPLTRHVRIILIAYFGSDAATPTHRHGHAEQELELQAGEAAGTQVHRQHRAPQQRVRQPARQRPRSTWCQVVITPRCASAATQHGWPPVAQPHAHLVPPAGAASPLRLRLEVLRCTDQAQDMVCAGPCSPIAALSLGSHSACSHRQRNIADALFCCP